MEDSGYVEVSIKLAFGFVFAIFALQPFSVLAYSTVTHSALTGETIDFFNKNFLDLKFSSAEEIEFIKKGSIGEDDGFRPLNHFYDPVYNRGLVLSNIDIDNPQVAIVAANVKPQFSSSKEWANNTKLQAGLAAVGLGSVSNLFSARDDYSWERAIYEYAWGDRNRGLEALGHVLHLIQDASVPDHTRNDPHPPFFDELLNQASPYEGWTKNFDEDNIDVVSKLDKKKPLILGSLGDYFDSLANYSNNNFFSKDTIFINRYDKPAILVERIERLSDGELYKFGYNNIEGDLNALVRIKNRTQLIKGGDIEYFIEDTDNLVLIDYWSRLSKQAVLHGAGVIKLFFDEVEKERKTKVLYNKNRSWAQKVFDATKNSIFNVASVFYGSSVTQADLEDDLETPFPSEQAEAVVIEQPSQQLSAEESAAETTIETSDLESDLAVKPPSEEPDEVLEEHEVNPDIQSPFSLVAIPVGAVGAGGGNNDVATNTASSASQTTTPQDTTSPDLIFSINECSNSLSFGCLSTSTTATLVWSSAASDLASYELSCTAGGGACAGFPKNFSATSSVSQTESLNDFTAYSFILKATDESGNETSISREIETASRPVVINEVAWMGTASSTDDEWIELKNNTSQAINFSNKWVLRTSDNAPYISLSGSIPANGYYLLERTDDLTINDIAANQIYGNNGTSWALNNTGENMLLEYVSAWATSTMDEIASCANWCLKGDNNSGSLPKRTMERVDSLSSGTDWNNWVTALGEFILNGHDASGAAIGGTPKSKNSASFVVSTTGSIALAKTLKKSNSPYLISRSGLTISNSGSLTIEPGVVIKFVSADSPSLTANGTIQASGSASDPVIFTAFEDDNYGGDMNGDGVCNPSANCPSPGTFKQILINSSSANSSFSNTLIRYGGKWVVGMTMRGAIVVDNTSVTFASTTIEHSQKHGLYLNNSISQISGSTFRSNGDSTDNTDAAGVYSASSSPTITSSTFASNRYGLYLDGSPQASVSSSVFNGNAVEAVRVNFSNKAAPSFSSNTGSNNAVNGIVLVGTIGGLATSTINANSLSYVLKTVDIAASSTLTFETGVIVKGYPNDASFSGKLTVKNGAKLFLDGASASDLVFTSLYDDTVGGNTDNSANSPSAGNWFGIVVESGGQIQLKGFTLRYAGLQTGIGAGDNRAGINIDQGLGSVELALIENNFQDGIRLNSVSSFSVKNSTIRNHTEEALAQAAGVQAVGSDVNLENITFSGNDLDIRASGAYSVSCTNCGSPVTSPSPL